MRCALVAFTGLLATLPVRAADLPADWAFRPRTQSTPPVVMDRSSVRNPIDAFILSRLEAAGLKIGEAADRATLIRRLYLDLIGLPPTPEQVRAFVHDPSPDAYERLVNRLLATPQFGERQATMWLDLVRFAESDGFKADDPRPNAWRFRDYVIGSFNSDKPYDRFVQEQLAGDELFPGDVDALIATGYLRLWPDEYNAVNLEQRRQETLNDITDTTAAAFLGLTAGCAKCHDHKYDPIPQIDYYRLQAFFAAFWPTDAPIGNPAELDVVRKQLAEWERQTAELRKQLEDIERPYRESSQRKQRGRFVEEYASILDVPAAKRTPLQRQIGAMIERQVYSRAEDVGKSMKGPVKEQWQAMKKQMAEFERLRPPPSPTAPACTDVGPEAPKTHLLKRGDWRKPAEEVSPGFLTAIATPASDAPLNPRTATTGRRSAFARWITRPDHPLTARVLVNRIWQMHFGRGIVGTSSDFGAQGDRPTHPQLLDWLADEFVRHGWSLKWLHQTIITSATYRQSSLPSAEALRRDPDNQLFSRMPRRRLEGEALRDAMLSVSGQLQYKAGGPSVFPEMPEEIKKSAKNWPVSADEAERNRRSVYIAVRRNLRYPLLAIFDAPDRNETCARRFATTTAPQALTLLNDPIVLRFAERFGDRVLRETGAEPGRIADVAWRAALARAPTDAERERVARFLRETGGGGDASFRDAVVHLCHALLNVNEFLFVD